MPSVNSAFRASVLLVIEAFSKKLVGLVSTLILARILTPADFGIVAIATLAFGLLEVFSQTGYQQFIITAKRIRTDKLNTAFTYNFLIKLFIAACFFVVSPFIASFYEDQRLTHVLYVFAAMLAFVGLENPMVSVLKRQQKYQKIVAMIVTCKIVSVAFAITIALTTKSYWALIIGQFIAYVTPIIGGYIIFPYKPKLTLANFKQQLEFSGWLIPASLFGYFRTQIDTLIVSKLFDSSVLGGFHVMKYLALIPNIHIIDPLTRPLLAQLSPLKESSGYFTKMFNLSTFVTASVAFPISYFIYMHADSVIVVLLGEQWQGNSHFFSLFGIMVFFTAVFHSVNNLYYIFNNTKLSFFFEFSSFLAISTILLILNFDSSYEFARTKVITEVVFIIAFFFYTTSRYTGVLNACYMTILIVPIIFSAMVANKLAQYVVDFDIGLLYLILSSSIFFSFYFIVFVLIVVLLSRKIEELQYLKTLVKDKYQVVKMKF